MARGRQVVPLTDLKVRRKTKPGLHADGNGLYLKVTKSGSKSWIYRYRGRDMGLGAYPAVSLSDARAAAQKNARLRAKGLDPIEERDNRRRHAELQRLKSRSFKDLALELIDNKKAEWRTGGKSLSSWMGSFENHVFPEIGDTPVGEVSAEQVLRVLRPIWQSHTETATRVRGRIESVLDYAELIGLRQPPNPASWKQLQYSLPRPSKIKPVRHHAALPYQEVPELFASLLDSSVRIEREVAYRGKYALAFLILTAARSSEATHVPWAEIDQQAGLWTCFRMKSGRSHTVPLSPLALMVLEHMSDLQKTVFGESPFVFPGASADSPVSDTTVRKLLHGRGVTIHGFRSSFVEWCREEAEVPREVSEMILDHATPGKQILSYERRSEMLGRKREVLDKWSEHCGSALPQCSGWS